MTLLIGEGRRILALDENDIYIVEQDVNIGDKKVSNKFDFLAKKNRTVLLGDSHSRMKI